MQDLLAQAAADCGANARALMHFETHVRAAHGGGWNPAALKSTVYRDDEVSFLQVCSYLTPLLGIHQTSTPQLKDTAFSTAHPLGKAAAPVTIHAMHCKAPARVTNFHSRTFATEHFA